MLLKCHNIEGEEHSEEEYTIYKIKDWSSISYYNSTSSSSMYTNGYWGIEGIIYA